MFGECAIEQVGGTASIASTVLAQAGRQTAPYTVTSTFFETESLPSLELVSSTRLAGH